MLFVAELPRSEPITVLGANMPWLTVVHKRFNKRREDFPDLRSYNDYLEQVEDISKLFWTFTLSKQN